MNVTVNDLCLILLHQQYTRREFAPKKSKQREKFSFSFFLNFQFWLTRARVLPSTTSSSSSSCYLLPSRGALDPLRHKKLSAKTKFVAPYNFFFFATLLLLLLLLLLPHRIIITKLYSLHYWLSSEDNKTQTRQTRLHLYHPSHLNYTLLLLQRLLITIDNLYIYTCKLSTLYSLSTKQNLNQI